MVKKYEVKLSRSELEQLETIKNKGKVQVRKLKRVQMLLMSHGGYKDEEIADLLEVGRATVERVRKKFVLFGLEAILNEKPRPGKPRKLDGSEEAFLIATACSSPPTGRECWTMQLLADKLVQLQVIDSISDETIRRTLKKTKLNRG